jgi:hypothetical protein
MQKKIHPERLVVRNFFKDVLGMVISGRKSGDPETKFSRL